MPRPGRPCGRIHTLHNPWVPQGPDHIITPAFLLPGTVFSKKSSMGKYHAFRERGAGSSRSFEPRPYLSSTGSGSGLSARSALRLCRPHTRPSNQLTWPDQPGKVGETLLSERARLARLLSLLLPPALCGARGEGGRCFLNAWATWILYDVVSRLCWGGGGVVHHSFPNGIFVLGISPDSCSLWAGQGK